MESRGHEFGKEQESQDGGRFGGSKKMGEML